jgi:hypothetical protein
MGGFFAGWNSNGEGYVNYFKNGRLVATWSTSNPIGLMEKLTEGNKGK